MTSIFTMSWHTNCVLNNLAMYIWQAFKLWKERLGLFTLWIFSLYWIYFSLCRKLLAYNIETLKSVPGTNQYWAMSVKFLAQGNNGLPPTGFEPMRLVILRLLVRSVNHSTTPPLWIFDSYLKKKFNINIWVTYFDTNFIPTIYMYNTSSQFVESINVNGIY